MTQEALKLALEALEKCRTYQQQDWSSEETTKPEVKQAITAIKEALREHAMREVQRLVQEIEQEPVAWVSEDVCEGQLINGRPRKIWWECNKGVGTAFYTHPPQRTWVGLTDEEIEQIGLSNYIKVVRETEAKLKELNA